MMGDQLLVRGKSSPNLSPVLHRPIPTDRRLGHDLAQPEPRQGGVVQLDAEGRAARDLGRRDLGIARFADGERPLWFGEGTSPPREARSKMRR
jgi:hypothetical protein